MPTVEQIQHTSSPLAPIGRAFYLASSWTWCIGMFLPLLLIRDFGPWAWVVFAAPNVIGAAAMGWVLSRPGLSESLIAAHRPAMRLFSLITVAFHAAFFTLVLAPMLRFTNVPGWMLILPGAALILSRGVFGVLGSIFTYIVSTVVMVILIKDGAVDRAQQLLPAPLLPASQLLFMLPVCTFGFLFCPYLDLTFHRARRETSTKGARVGFTLGFGLFFLLMIAATPLYGPLFWTGQTRAIAVMAGMSLPVWIHIATQLFYTCGIHSAECGTETSGTETGKPTLRANAWSRACRAILVIAAALALLFSNSVPDAPLLADQASAPLIWYRLFMSAYGLLFPAYIWLCMIPRRGERSTPPSPRHIIVWLASCLIASPFYWYGFMERKTIWLLPGLALVLACRTFIPPRVQPLPPPRSL